MSGRLCSICSSAHKADVEDALLLGTSVRAIASQFALSKSAISRHRHNCLGPKVAAASRLLATAAETRADVDQAEEILTGEVIPSHGEVLTLTGLLGRLARSLDRLDGAADQAARQETYMALAALSGQLHKGVEAAAKMHGQVRRSDDDESSFTININLG